MANKTRSTFAKRQKELARQERQKNKLSRRLEKKAAADANRAAAATSEDPDLVGIEPGPQPAADDAGEDEGEGSDPSA